jgi:hypothetical protein
MELILKLMGGRGGRRKGTGEKERGGRKGE